MKDMFADKQTQKEKKMPNLDRTGPMGRGEKTGRGMGRCTCDETENYSQIGYGYGRGRGGGGRGRGFGGGRGRGGGRGFGFGQGRGYGPRPEMWDVPRINTPETTSNDDLKQELEFLKRQQNEINRAIQAIENKLPD